MVGGQRSPFCPHLSPSSPIDGLEQAMKSIISIIKTAFNWMVRGCPRCAIKERNLSFRELIFYKPRADDMDGK